MPGQPSQISGDTSRIIFRFPRNWTAVVFFGLLGLVHWSMALAARHTGAQMSIVFGSLFIGISGSSILIRRQVILLADRKRILVQIVFGPRAIYQRSLTFGQVVNVRVSLLAPNHCEASLCIVCAGEDIELPATRTPRQTALLLAITMDVPLVKIYGQGTPPEPAQRIARLFRNEDAIE